MPEGKIKGWNKRKKELLISSKKVKVSLRE